MPLTRPHYQAEQWEAREGIRPSLWAPTGTAVWRWALTPVPGIETAISAQLTGLVPYRVLRLQPRSGAKPAASPAARFTSPREKHQTGLAFPEPLFA